MPAAIHASRAGDGELALGLPANISSWVTGGDGFLWLLRPCGVGQDLQSEGGKDWGTPACAKDEGYTGGRCSYLDAEMGFLTIANDAEAEIAAGWFRQDESCWRGKTWPAAAALPGGYANDHRSRASSFPIADDAAGNDTGLESAAHLAGGNG